METTKHQQAKKAKEPEPGAKKFRDQPQQEPPWSPAASVRAAGLVVFSFSPGWRHCHASSGPADPQTRRQDLFFSRSLESGSNQKKAYSGCTTEVENFLRCFFVQYHLQPTTGMRTFAEPGKNRHISSYNIFPLNQQGNKS